MPIVFQDLYTIEDCKENLSVLYVFGDNTKRLGSAGQAIIRYQPNAIGLITKRFPCHNETCYLNDSDLPLVILENHTRLDDIVCALNDHRLVVWPSAGIGTGLAQLHIRAPLIKQFYDLLLQSLQKISSTPA